MFPRACPCHLACHLRLLRLTPPPPPSAIISPPLPTQVDMAALRQMTEADLEALGIPMGPRKKIIAMLA